VSETLEQIEVEDAREQIAGGKAQALDVRDDEAWNDAHIPGAVNETDDLQEGLPVIVVADGDPPEVVVTALGEGDFEVAVLAGGMDSWKQADFTIQPSDDIGEDEGEHGTGREETPA
jgi:rhodanese-related sulfurtransferase